MPKTLYTDFLPGTDSTHSIGSDSVRWLKLWGDTSALGTLLLGAGSITDSSGAISFDNEILSAGGINITNVGAAVIPITAKGAAAQSADLQQWLDSSDNVLARISSDGSLGIGVTPSYPIDVYKDTNGIFRIHIKNPNAGNLARSGFLFEGEDGDSWGGFDHLSSGFYGGSDSEAVSPNSAVLFCGIGDTNGLALCAPRSTAPIRFYAGGTAAANEVMRMVANKVGINKTPTAEALEVNGNIQPTGYKSSDGSAGIVETLALASGEYITVKNGLITEFVSAVQFLFQDVAEFLFQDEGEFEYQN